MTFVLQSSKMSIAYRSYYSVLHEEAILLQNQDRHIKLPIIYVSFPLPHYIENPRYGPGGVGVFNRRGVVWSIWFGSS